MTIKPITVEDVCDSSVTVTLSFQDSSLGNVVGYTLWHRKADDLNYPPEPTCTLFSPSTKFLLSGLTRDTDYLLKVVSLDSKRELGMSEIHFRTASAGIQEPITNPKSMDVERSESPTTNCSSLSNPSSVEDETNNVIPCSNDEETRENNYLGHCNRPDNNSSADLFNGYAEKIERGITGETISQLDGEQSMGKITSRPVTDAENLESKHALDEQMTEDTSTENESNTPLPTGKECVPYLGSSEAVLPIATPSKADNTKDGVQRSRPKPVSQDLDNGSEKEEPQAGSSSKKRSAKRQDEESTVVDKDFEYYVKVIRWLECDGHIGMGFRQKFLTWYSLRATEQEMRIVKVFVDTLIEDPESLAGQLIDTFSDVISNKRSATVPAGFCLKLWH